jgi:hypothetical protein
MSGAEIVQHVGASGRPRRYVLDGERPAVRPAGSEVDGLVAEHARRAVADEHGEA